MPPPLTPAAVVTYNGMSARRSYLGGARRRAPPAKRIWSSVNTLPAPHLRRAALLVAALLVAAVSGCGREAPSFAPGVLEVTSTPAGAAVTLDGLDTGLVTPATFDPLEAGLHEVSVGLDGWVASPAVRTVDLGYLGRETADFTLSQTGLSVSSTPPGARILIDGEDTGVVTPAIVGLPDGGTFAVSLDLDGYAVFPAGVTAVVDAGRVTVLEADAFTLRPRRTVVLEGFANVDCGPCPQMTDNLLALTGDPAYGPDRVVFIEFSVSWPNLQDPFYQANPTENYDRFFQYLVAGAPTLIADGVKLGSAVDQAVLRPAVDADLAGDPGVLVDVSLDGAASPATATVTLTALRDVDLAGQVLFVALYETGIVLATPPGSNGQTEFHHVFRDRADTLPVLGALVAGQQQAHAVALQLGGRDPATVEVVAFIQDPATLAVLQAGSTAATSRVPPLAEGMHP